MFTLNTCTHLMQGNADLLKKSVGVDPVVITAQNGFRNIAA